MKVMQLEGAPDLDEAQWKVVASKAAKKVVLAGPGSGKTRVLASAVAAEVARHGSAGLVVCCYTNAGAAELRHRLAAAGVGAEPGYVGTTHGLCLRLVQEHWQELKLPQVVTVLDEEQRESALLQAVEGTGLMACVKKDEVWLMAETYRGLAVRPHLAVDVPTLPLFGNPTPAQAAARMYVDQCRHLGELDFDALLHYGRLAARYHPCHALFVDEYQDASPQDAALYEALDPDRAFVVGDPDQAVYSFRGGDPLQLLRLVGALTWDSKAPEAPKHRISEVRREEWGAGWEVWTLERSYRNAGKVCFAASSLIAHNKLRVAKQVAPAGEPDDWVDGSVTSVEFAGPIDEASWVAREIKAEKLHAQAVAKQGKGDGELSAVVLCRTNKTAETLRIRLAGYGLEVSQESGGSVGVDQKRYLAALLTARLAPWNDNAVERMMSYKVGWEAAAQLKRYARSAGKTMAEHVGLSASPLADLDSLHLSPELGAYLHDACRELSAARGSWNLSDLVLYLGQKDKRERTPGVEVTTVHQSKGREWESVYVVGCEEGLFPSGQAVRELGEDGRITGMEEERRLMYVAVTRARRRLALTWCRIREPQWGGATQAQRVSRFVAEAGLGGAQ